jgi:hypothetical protein
MSVSLSFIDTSLELMSQVREVLMNCLNLDG